MKISKFFLLFCFWFSNKTLPAQIHYLIKTYKTQIVKTVTVHTKMKTLVHIIPFDDYEQPLKRSKVMPEPMPIVQSLITVPLKTDADISNEPSKTSNATLTRACPSDPAKKKSSKGKLYVISAIKLVRIIMRGKC